MLFTVYHLLFTRLISALHQYSRRHESARFREILLEGLATDGGLAMPESYPRYEAPDLARLRKLKYRDLAFDILSRYIDDIPAADLKRLIRAAALRRRDRLILAVHGAHTGQSFDLVRTDMRWGPVFSRDPGMLLPQAS